MKRIAVAQLKGGVGKSTLTLLLAEVWAVLRGQRVLVVDLDPQSSVTFMLISAQKLDQQQAAHRTLPHFFEDSLLGRTQKAASYIVHRVGDVVELHDPSQRGFVSLLPTTPNLWFHEYDFDRAKYSAQSDPVAARESVLRALLDEVAPLYDVVLIDSCFRDFGRGCGSIGL